jgi:GDP-D-mannose dehydratase
VTHVERTAPDEVIYHLANESFIKASLRQSVEATLSNLSTVLRSEEFAHLQTSNFHYIDLRFGSKVFINEEVPGMATSSPAEL